MLEYIRFGARVLLRFGTIEREGIFLGWTEDLSGLWVCYPREEPLKHGPSLVVVREENVSGFQNVERYEPLPEEGDAGTAPRESWRLSRLYGEGTTPSEDLGPDLSLPIGTAPREGNDPPTIVLPKGYRYCGSCGTDSKPLNKYGYCEQCEGWEGKVTP